MIHVRPETIAARTAAMRLSRMTLRFVVKGPDGQVLAEGERKLVDHGFLTGTNVNSNDSLRYEKRLIDDWLRREFKDNAALTATR